ncbi:alpha/beta fold hydrolase, partial [Mycobacterium tuberculosis]
HERFDLVGFDPRGVASSRPAIWCNSDADNDRHGVHSTGWSSFGSAIRARPPTTRMQPTRTNATAASAAQINSMRAILSRRDSLMPTMLPEQTRDPGQRPPSAD